MKFRSKFVQYPRQLTYVVMLFDLLMMLVLAKFVFILLVAGFLGTSFNLLPFPVSTAVFVLVSAWCLITIYCLWLDFLACMQSGLRIEGSVVIERFGNVSEHDLKEVKGIDFVEARLLLPVCHYAVLKLKNSQAVVEITREDRDELQKALPPGKRFRIPFLLSISSTKPG